MGFPAVEIAYAPATDGLKARPRDPDLVKDAVAILKSSEGRIEYVSALDLSLRLCGASSDILCL